jgi:hypothetical protein
MLLQEVTLLKMSELTVFQIRVSTEETQQTCQVEPETCNPTQTGHTICLDLDVASLHIMEGQVD